VEQPSTPLAATRFCLETALDRLLLARAPLADLLAGGTFPARSPPASAELWAIHSSSILDR
jgi:hypothetical protein